MKRFYKNTIDPNRIKIQNANYNRFRQKRKFEIDT